MGNRIYRRSCFPFVPACCVTVHKIQGDTIPYSVFVPETKVGRPAADLVYVGLTRATGPDSQVIMGSISYHDLVSLQFPISVRVEEERQKRMMGNSSRFL